MLNILSKHMWLIFKKFKSSRNSLIRTHKNEILEKFQKLSWLDKIWNQVTSLLKILSNLLTWHQGIITKGISQHFQRKNKEISRTQCCLLIMWSPFISRRESDLLKKRRKRSSSNMKTHFISLLLTKKNSRRRKSKMLLKFIKQWS